VRIGFNTDCVHAAVRQVIDAKVAEDPDNERGDRLDERLMAHLEDPREVDDIADPISALIARICRDLGLAVDWSLWEDEEWAVTEWRDAVRGSPYAPGGRRPSLKRNRNSGPRTPCVVRIRRTGMPRRPWPRVRAVSSHPDSGLVGPRTTARR